jgi:hypothetical protein
VCVILGTLACFTLVSIVSIPVGLRMEWMDGAFCWEKGQADPGLSASRDILKSSTDAFRVRCLRSP